MGVKLNKRHHVEPGSLAFCETCIQPPRSFPLHCLASSGSVTPASHEGLCSTSAQGAFCNGVTAATALVGLMLSLADGSACQGCQFVASACLFCQWSRGTLGNQTMSYIASHLHFQNPNQPPNHQLISPQTTSHYEQLHSQPLSWICWPSDLVFCGIYTLMEY